MGTYLNPGNEGFRTSRNGVYVDKSGLIKEINNVIETKMKLTCISRPRRFGKSYAAQMLCAYYGKGCDSSGLFSDLAISKDSSCAKHMNKYDVIYIDMTTAKAEFGSYKGVTKFLADNITREIVGLYPDVTKGLKLGDTLLNAVEITGNKFIAIIDEWDSPIRESSLNDDAVNEYLEFLRGLFKSSQITDKAFAAAYITGILPIKKDGTQSAVSEFKEYNMLSPRNFASFVGFTEDEVLELCKGNDMDYESMKRWYDGYELPGVGAVYNPNSVMEAIHNRAFESYWKMSSAASSLLDYINMDYYGLGEDVVGLLAGKDVPVDTMGFENDPNSIKSKDDVLTLLVHFGYLNYDEATGTVHIPNEEVRVEFARSVRMITHTETIERVRESDKLIADTIAMNADAVAAQIEKIHRQECEPLFYNNEQSLRAVIKLAYFAYKDKFTQFEELPGGDGYADVVYLPKKKANVPILIIELKWDESAEGAIAQIKNKNYPKKLEDREEPILLVGISYDKKAPDKKHGCVIEVYDRNAE